MKSTLRTDLVTMLTHTTRDDASLHGSKKFPVEFLGVALLVEFGGSSPRSSLRVSYRYGASCVISTIGGVLHGRVG